MRFHFNVPFLPLTSISIGASNILQHDDVDVISFMHYPKLHTFKPAHTYTERVGSCIYEITIKA